MAGSIDFRGSTEIVDGALTQVDTALGGQMFYQDTLITNTQVVNLAGSPITVRVCTRRHQNRIPGGCYIHGRVDRGKLARHPQRLPPPGEGEEDECYGRRDTHDGTPGSGVASV